MKEQIVTGVSLLAAVTAYFTNRSREGSRTESLYRAILIGIGFSLVGFFIISKGGNNQIPQQQPVLFDSIGRVHKGR